MVPVPINCDIGLLQTKAYRILKKKTNSDLAPLSISSTHWTLLGIMSANEEGIPPGDATRELGLKVSFG